MSKKTHDIVIKVGEYTATDGQAKAQYKTIGRMMEDDQGGQFLLLDSTILSMQTLYLANRDRRSHVIASLFEDRPKSDPDGSYV